MSTDRRDFLKLLSTAAATAAFPASIAHALAIPANQRTGTIEDVEHIVFMMQENRSFDHYFGTLRGVRGYGDPRAVTLPTGKSVWHQPDPTNPDRYVLPFHPGAPNLGLQFLEDLAHDWTTTHLAWNNGRYDQSDPQQRRHGDGTPHPQRHSVSLRARGRLHSVRRVLLLAPRTDRSQPLPHVDGVGRERRNGPRAGRRQRRAGYGWSTFPERLDDAGISWRIYQDVGEGLDAAHFWGWGEDAYIGNYGDNSLLYFFQYQNAPDGSPLARKARTGTNILKNGSLFDVFRKDVLADRLPQVSWVVAPEAYTEHPNWPANYGAWYISQVLDALTANPDVWSKTVFIFMFDENDGFFDHMVPPTPPQSRAEGLSTIDTTNELFPGSATYPAGPYTPRRARADDRDLPVEQRGMGLLGGVRPYIARAVR